MHLSDVSDPLKLLRSITETVDFDPVDDFKTGFPRIVRSKHCHLRAFIEKTLYQRVQKPSGVIARVSNVVVSQE